MAQGSPASDFETKFLQSALQRRRAVGSIRSLSKENNEEVTTSPQKQQIDFSSNDYLGLSHSSAQHALVEKAYAQLSQQQQLLGATGSRLLTGDSSYAHQLEHKLATLHKRPSALLCNSGYDANLAVLSSLAQYGTFVLDELCHNSLFVGVKLGGQTSKPITFRHNDLVDLKRILQQSSPQSVPTIIVVESVYSMDGDIAPLREILDLARYFNCVVVVDEAHGLGILGSSGLGLLEELEIEHHPSLLCSIHTFGKAAGCHGAVVCGSKTLREYLINYARPVIYSTFLPLHSLVCISCAYDTMSNQKVGAHLRKHCFGIVRYFRTELNKVLDQQTNKKSCRLADSTTPIQALLIPGNQNCSNFCKVLWKASNYTIKLYPIRSPTVPKGQERVRIVLHAHNSFAQVDELIRLIRIVLESQNSGDGRIELRSKL